MIILAVVVFATILSVATPTRATPLSEQPPPVVKLDEAVFTGLSEATVSSFLGIPFAQPPVGDLRFRLPLPSPPYTGRHIVTNPGPACPQLAPGLPLLSGLPDDAISAVLNVIDMVANLSSEDCLTLDVITPAGASPSAKLPVVVVCVRYCAGAFEFGSSSTMDGRIIVERGLEINEPIIYVSMNFRTATFGFLASQEVKDAGVGNLGLQDQRLALRWVQKYINAFGGDPARVTIWGESSGAASVALQMLTNGGNTDGLFRAAFMQSGSPLPVGDITNGQPYYDDLVLRTGCTGSPDTLGCLRSVDYDVLKAAVDKSPGVFSYQSLHLAWLPRADGVFLTEPPQHLVRQGSVANIPFVSGDCDDEGTLFSFANSNVTTDSQYREYVKTFWLSAATDEVIDTAMELYPSDITQGSPFDTGDLNALTPQFKRLAAIQGDMAFQAPRRFFLQQRSGKQQIWSFLFRRLKFQPFLGSTHTSDLLDVYGPGDMTDYLIRFVANLDPNGKSGIYWPEYTTQFPSLLTFLDGPVPLTIIQDTYREDAMNFLTEYSLAYPI
ncbi:alpha/beta-hydrolase [Leucogyrophana mollusca]|uniref:Alpha/beta-hydrolase n=1 Tax=Leucogyrophana mollusca TaxID=85980 RepID=A0ACB8BSU1_9AGAM|nr:alpha/beta-hydrolase [Leucogyrophana mollusca]